MTRRRRELLVTAGTVAGVALAGCSFGSDTQPTAESRDVPSWTDWVPATEFSEDTTVVHCDISAARDQFPEDLLAAFEVNWTAESFGIDPERLTDVLRVEANGRLRAAILSASVSPDELLAQIDDQYSVETYNGYSVVDLPQREDVALRDSGIILAASPRAYIDAEAGETARALYQQTPARETLGRVADAPFSGIVPGEEAPGTLDLLAEPNWRGVGILTQSDGTPVFVTHLQFGSADQAATALDQLEDELPASTTDADSAITSTQDGRYVVVEIERDTISLDGLFP